MPIDGSDFSLQAAGLKSVGKDVLGDIECRIYNREPVRHTGRWKLWVRSDDPHCLPLKFVKHSSDGNRLQEFRINTTIDDKGNARLLGWDFTRYSFLGGQVVESQAVKMTECLINKPVFENEFSLRPFPHGSTVNDTVRDKRYVVRHRANGDVVHDELAYYDAQFVLEPDPSSGSKN